jgi:hypothetical protein
MDELSVHPMDETRKMYELILDNQFNPREWPGDQLTPIIPSNRNTDQAIRPLVRRALKKIHGLQAIIDSTSNELKVIEKMINEAMSDSSQ